MNNTTNNKKTFKVILSLSILFILTGIYIYTAKQEQIKKVAKTEKKPAQRLKPLEYEGAMVVKDVSDINDIMNELENEPTAGGGSFDEQDIANSITKEALQAFSDSQERALPLIAHWNVGGDRESIFNPSAMLQKLQEGDHILVSWKLEPYYNSEIPLSYYEESIKKAAALHLPLVFITPAPESALVYDNYYASLSGTQNPDVVTANGEILEKLSPFGDSELWNEVGEQWSSTSLMAQLQEWYPNPPLVIFVSENEVDKLKWSDVEDDVRYTDKDQDDNFKRTLIDAEWIEKYRQLHEGFKKGFSQKAWKDNVKFITYNKLSQNLGKTTDWVDNATYTNNYINIWPLTADGVTVDFNLQESESDNSANAPHVLINNLPFMLSEAKAVNPHFTYQLNINDNDTITTPARYRGLTQFALWFLRPSTIRQGSTLTEDSKLSTMFQEVVDSAEMIHYNTQLADFWKNGSLVTSGVSDLNVNVPTEYKNDPRWFLLNTDANPPRPWSDSTSISVWAFALVKGKAPNREWLLYAQSPEGDKKDVTITLPEYGDLMVDTSEMGSFYVVKEGGSTTKSVVTADVDKTPTNPYLEQFTLPTCDATNPEVFFIKSNDDWSHINDKDKTIFCVSPGDYSSLGSVELTASGSEDKRRYIVLDNGNDVHPASLDESEQANISLVFNSASYWIVDRMSSLHSNANNSYELLDGSIYNIFNNMHTNDMNQAFIIRENSHNNTIQNSKIENMKKSARDKDKICIDLYPLNISNYSEIKNTKIINNEIKNCSDGIQLARKKRDDGKLQDANYEGTIIDSNNIYIENTLYTDGKGNFTIDGTYASAENAIDIKVGSDNLNNPVIISNNHLWGFKRTDTTDSNRGDPGSAVAIHFNTKNVNLDNNIILNSARGISIADKRRFDYAAENIRISNNIFYHIGFADEVNHYDLVIYDSKNINVKQNISRGNNLAKWFIGQNWIESIISCNVIIDSMTIKDKDISQMNNNYVKSKDIELKDIDFTFKKFSISTKKILLNSVKLVNNELYECKE